jgi:hypothetical protein
MTTTYEPVDTAQPDPAPALTNPSVKRRGGLWIATGVSAGLVAIGAVVVGATVGQPTPLEKAYSQYEDLDITSSSIELVDDGHTIIVDGEGAEESGAPIEAIASLIKALEMPTSIVTKIENTRALDGTQSDSWDGIEVSWSYHPDSGIDMVFELTEE